MIELRLCSISVANWLNTNDVGKDLILPKGLGRTFSTAIRTWSRSNRKPTIEGLALAKSGYQFESAEFPISVVHALACASEFGESSKIDFADEIDLFLRGQGLYSKMVPKVFMEFGVISVLERTKSRLFAKWIQSVSDAEFIFEVSSMHGEAAVPEYQLAAKNLRIIFESVESHECDLACMVPKSCTFMGRPLGVK